VRVKIQVRKNETDLGYHPMKMYCGKGFATEAARACIQYGFETLGLQIIMAKL